MEASKRQPEPALEAKGISKAYGGIVVLDDVSLTFGRGEVHALIGENGAGKSTLMKILGGYVEPSAGELILNDARVRFSGPRQAEAAGIVLVHQEILLAPHLSIAENIFLGRELHYGLFTDDGAMRQQASSLLASLGSRLDPRSTVADLSIAERQLVQIARALSSRHSFVIFDEPTAALTPVESETLFAVIEALRQRHCGVIYISHRLDEVKRLADRVSVLRDGQLVHSGPARELSPTDMAHLMVGRALGDLYPHKAKSEAAPVVLEVQDLNVAGRVQGASFTLRQGEVLGFAGLIGAGRTELFEGLFGLRKASGQVACDGHRGSVFASVNQAASCGLAYVTEDRKGRGLLLEKSLAQNLTLSRLQQFVRFGLIDNAKEHSALNRAVQRFDIRAPRLDIDAGRLSGGNQQKLLLAKTLLSDPRIVVIDEPTRGVDIGAKQQIYKLIAELAAAGKAVVVISSEMPELIGLCHRIVVMRQGRIAGLLTGDQINERAIVTLATGTEQQAA